MSSPGTVFPEPDAVPSPPPGPQLDQAPPAETPPAAEPALTAALEPAPAAATDGEAAPEAAGETAPAPEAEAGDGEAAADGEAAPAVAPPVDPARAERERTWAAIEAIKKDDGVVRGRVTEAVKGGLILDIGLRGFLPASLVEMRRVRDLQPYVGRELEAKVIELDRARNNVVLSRRAFLEQSQSKSRDGLLHELAKGQVRRGIVSSVVAFGVFVDLGGVDGLVHVSELSWRHVDHPSEVVHVGQEVEVEVLEVDLARGRVSLSLKATQEDPWRHFARAHAIGQIVTGTVTKLVPFGAFVRVDDGIEGLVHISELSERHVDAPEQVAQVGQQVLAKVIDIDLERRRISLSLKQADEEFVEEFDPTLYGMAATYDAEGNYVYPDGFDPETGDWLEGFEAQREAWEQEYADAQLRWEAHRRQVEASRG